MIWTITRFLQYWNGVYASRQLLGMTLLLQGLSYDGYLFIPLMLIIQFLFLEFIPYLYCLDKDWLDQMGSSQIAASL